MRTLCLLLGMAAAVAAGPSLTITDTEVTSAGPRQLVARGAIAVDGFPNRWYGVYFQVCGPDKRPLLIAGKALLREWGKVFTPDKNVEPIRWTDIRFGLPFDELEKAANLPRGRAVLWIVCDLWDPTGKGSWAANGWDVACPVEVAVDDAGRITSARALHAQPRRPATRRTSERKPARAARLALTHLVLKKDVRVARCVGEKHTIYDTLWRDWQEAGPNDTIRGTHEQASLRGLDYGRFFETLTTAEQARELVLLGHRDHAIVAAPVAGMKEAAPAPHWGVEVAAVPGVGWRVSALLYVPERYEIVHFDYVVRTDGRLGQRHTVCYTGVAEGLTPIAHPLRLLPDAIKIPARVHEIDDYLEPEEWPDFAK